LMQSEFNNPNSLNNSSIREIYLDEDSVLWIGGYGGLNKYDRKNNQFTNYIGNDPDVEYVGNIYSITPDAEDKNILWLGNEGGGLYKFRKDTESFRLIHPQKYVADVFSIVDDKKGNLWLGTWYGLFFFNKESETLIPGIPGMEQKELYKELVNYIYQDREGMLWMATNFGLHRYDRSSVTLKKFIHDPTKNNSISYNSIKSIYEDKNGNLWVGTNGGGINKMDRKNETFVSYTTKDGLPNNVVYGILEDDQGFLWLSTNKGISKFDPVNVTFKNYTTEDGLQSNEFNTNSFYSSSAGELFFGGINGLNFFFPVEIKAYDYIPPIVITSFKIFDESVPFENYVYGQKIINLSYKENFISFEFSALDFTSPEQNKYAYKLEGFDENWNYSGKRRYASYTNLEGGEYIFKVKGTNSDGIWNEVGIAVPIYVKPAYWKTIWFHALLGLGGLVSILIIFRVRLNQVKLETRKEYFRRQNEEKGAMLKEIHHRVKNNLQVVNSLLRFQSHEIKDEKVVAMFEEAQNRVISMALLHEKLYRSEDLKHIDIQEYFELLIKDLVKNYEIDKNINLDVKVEGVDIGIKTLVPLGLIINEIITNSLKYAFTERKKGEIKVHLRHLENLNYELIIGDDGVGISNGQITEGLGTELVQIFTEQLEGNIERLDVPGTQFRLVFKKIDEM